MEQLGIEPHPEKAPEIPDDNISINSDNAKEKYFEMKKGKKYFENRVEMVEDMME